MSRMFDEDMMNGRTVALNFFIVLGVKVSGSSRFVLAQQCIPSTSEYNILSDHIVLMCHTTSLQLPQTGELSSQ